MELNPAIPLLLGLALINVAFVLRPASARWRLVVAVILAGLSVFLFKDWVEGLLYLLRMS